jgi:glutamate synthase (NADPH) large chain
MLIHTHYQYTNSQRAKYLLDNWQENISKFVKVMPTEYKKALKRLETEEELFEELTIA